MFIHGRLMAIVVFACSLNDYFKIVIQTYSFAWTVTRALCTGTASTDSLSVLHNTVTGVQNAARTRQHFNPMNSLLLGRCAQKVLFEVWQLITGIYRGHRKFIVLFQKDQSSYVDIPWLALTCEHDLSLTQQPFPLYPPWLHTPPPPKKGLILCIAGSQELT